MVSQYPSLEADIKEGVKYKDVKDNVKKKNHFLMSRKLGACHPTHLFHVALLFILFTF